MGTIQARIKSNKKGLTFNQNCETIKSVMRKLKWLVSDLGLNELNEWRWMIGAAALTAAVMVFALNL